MSNIPESVRGAGAKFQQLACRRLHERMMRIKQAVEVLKDCEDLTKPIDRPIAYALFVIALETEVQSAMAQDGKPWRDGQFHYDLHELQMATYGYLQGDLVFEEPD